MTLTNQSGYAKRHGVSEKTVSLWKKRGWVVIRDGKVDVEASDENLKKYRTAAPSPSLTQPTAGKGKGKTTAPPSVVQDPAPRGAADSPEDAAERILSASGAPWTTDEAKRIKENYLALLNQLKYEQESGELVPLVQAETVLFEEARKWRDAWMAFTATYAPLVAADLGVEPDRVIEVLSPHVYKQIAALGDPEGDFEA